MSTKNVIFDSMDLFYEILDFLPGSSPLVLKSTSKTWYYAIGKYRFRNFEVSFLPSNDDCTIINKINIPQYLINLTRMVRCRNLYPDIFTATIRNIDQQLDQFQHIRELNIDFLFVESAMRCWQTVTKLTLNFNFDIPDEFMFDGSKFELMHTLIVRSMGYINHDLIDHIKFPPGLTTLDVDGIINFPNVEDSFLPNTLKILKFYKGLGQISATNLPQNLKVLQAVENIESIPSSITSLCVGGQLPTLEKGHKLHELTLNDKQYCSIFNFSSITTLNINNSNSFNIIDLPSTLTELKMNVNNNMPLQTEDLPYSLLLLGLNITSEYQPRFFKLPPRLRVLRMFQDSSVWDNDIINDFPDSLTELEMTRNIHIHLYEDFLPHNLRKLSINADSLSIDPHSIPISVTSLRVLDYNRPFERNVLPDLLTSLGVHEFYKTENIRKSYFPSTLTYINRGFDKIDLRVQPRKYGCEKDEA